jgi:hypothetical protein
MTHVYSMILSAKGAETVRYYLDEVISYLR